VLAPTVLATKVIVPPEAEALTRVPAFTVPAKPEAMVLTVSLEL
jgi:hypothetical protein